MSCCSSACGGEASIPEFKFAVRKDLVETFPEMNFLPERANDTDTGWDVKCADPEGIVLKPFEYARIRLGFRIYSPPGWWLELRPRSSSHAKKHLNCLYGVLDEGWEGECLMSLQYLPPVEQIARRSGGIIGDVYYTFNGGIEPLRIGFGDKIGQLVPIRRKEMKVVEVSNEEFDKLCEQRVGARGAGGFGSTD